MKKLIGRRFLSGIESPGILAMYPELGIVATGYNLYKFRNKLVRILKAEVTAATQKYDRLYADGMNQQKKGC